MVKVLAAAVAAVCIVTSCLGQQAYWGQSDEAIFKMRVGSSMDAYELRYFGLLPADMPSADSLTYGVQSGAFFIRWHDMEHQKKVILNTEQQREFLKLIANYEALALDPSRLSLSSLRFLKVKTPLNRHETSGRDVLVQTKDSTYYGELAFIQKGHLGLYQVDIGYKAELAAKELVILPLGQLKTLQIFNRRIARFTGLGLGAAAAGALSAVGTSPLPGAPVNVQYASNFVLFPAIGFLLGLLYDGMVGVKKTYISPAKEPSLPQLEHIGRQQGMFRGALPPEILTRITQ